MDMPANPVWQQRLFLGSWKSGNGEQRGRTLIGMMPLMGRTRPALAMRMRVCKTVFGTICSAMPQGWS